MSETAVGKQQARDTVARLVREFREVAADHALNGAAEAQARTWIERLLVGFGWDPADPRQVEQERTIRGRAARLIAREGAVHRRPDYALVVGGKRAVYVDAKRFDVDIRECEQAAYQVRIYGWSEGMTLSYLCDFEELAIYDCRLKPSPDDRADVGRVLYLRCDEYLDHFDLLWEYFGREALESGSLLRRHPPEEKPRGHKPLDEDFEEQLSHWRREIAKSIVRYGKQRDPKIVSAAAQRILDRIIFLRFCEEIGLEEFGTLRTFGRSEDGFWPEFVEQTERRWRRVYDGILFPATEEDDPTGVETHLREWWLKGRIFRDLTQELYWPKPYCFDVIPLELLGGIYERYLGKRLRIVGGGIDDEHKPEYQRTKGAVYTPGWIVKRVVDKTLAPLAADRSPDALLALRVLDPACGSGSFLLGVFDFLERAVLDWCRAHAGSAEARRHAIAERDTLRLTPATARALIDQCIYAVDIDPEAVEVARMSLALRYVERTAYDEADEPADMLRGIGRNIKQGNAIVGPELGGLALDVAAIREVMPFDWRSEKHGFGAVLGAGGFDAVVGNPPYIEVKRYREWMPAMYRYLKEAGAYQTAAQGKTDIAMPFIERGVSLLGLGGRLGFIVQNRFFKTDYGELTRHWLRVNRLLAEIEDFRDVQVFAGRTTYTAILTLQQGSPQIRYRTFADRAAAEVGQASVDYRIAVDRIDDSIWSFEDPELTALHQELCRRHGALGQHRGVEITVGLQTLWGKLYQIAPSELTSRSVRGVNGLGETVSLDRGALRPLCRNRGFYPFRPDNADAWVVFPYEVREGEAREILWPEFEDRFPRTAAYLAEHRQELKKAVQVPAGAKRWHLYTRPQNLVQQTRPKVLFPSTIEDTVAGLDPDGNVYQDNVRMQALWLAEPAADLRAVCAVFNSSLFSALARLKAGLSDAGWRQLNRQYAELVPFPLARLADQGLAAPLALLADRIQSLQEAWRGTRGEGATASVEAALACAWSELDRAVEDLYDLSRAEREVAARYARQVDRVELLKRQISGGTAPPDAEE
ncbi:MAG: Eco57I restriction-modification methylase domain-containing protein [Deltaproteobacteria bacterium]|nr:Eco57I restriction-modification methylase domain-containing protein [Deltaproteobacteria bacterium]